MKRVALEAAFKSELFRALAKPTPVSLLEALMRAGGEANVPSIFERLPVDTSVVSRHLRELVQAGVLDVERWGQGWLNRIVSTHSLYRWHTRYVP